MKIVAVSDMHGLLPEIPECDILLIAGDLPPNHKPVFESAWLHYTFRDWLNDVPAKHIVGIAGNHDYIFETPHKGLIPKDLSWHYLEDSEVTIEGLKIYGTPWQLRFFDWAFNLDEDELAEKWKLIPDDTDILITHSPPENYGDFSSGHCGSPSLAKRVFEVKPKLHVFGHIHSDHGEWNVGDVQLANVTVVNEKYELVYEPFVFNIN